MVVSAIDNLCMTADCVKVSGSMLEKLNTSVDPCDDFYEYACGSWIQNARIPYLMLQWNEIYRIGMDAYTTVRRRFEDGALFYVYVSFFVIIAFMDSEFGRQLRK